MLRRPLSARTSIPTIALVGVALCVVPGPAAAFSDDGGATGPDLLGTWLQLESESEDPLEKAGDLVTGGGGGTTFGWNAGPYSGGNQGSGGAGQGRGNRGRGGRGTPPANAPSGFGIQRRELLQLADSLQVLRFEQTEASTLQLTDASRTTQVFFLDGRSVGDGFGGETTARVEYGVLLVDAQRPDRPGRVTVRGGAGEGPRRRSQTFAVLPAERPEDVRLEVVTSLLGGGSPQIEFKTVFERVRGGGTIRLPESAGTVAGSEHAVADREDVATTVAGTEESSSREAPTSVKATLLDESMAAAERTEALPPVSGSRARLVDFDRGAERGDESVARRGRPAVIRVLPLSTTPGQLISGKVEIQTLNIDPTIQEVEFLVDGERVGRRVLPPWEIKASLASPPREQVVEVRAYGSGERLLGSDRMVVNRLDPPFRVRLEKISGDPVGGELQIRVRVSVPREALLRDVQLFRNQDLVATLPSDVTDGRERGAESIERFETTLDVAGSSPQDFVRVLARLADGRELEDVRLIEEATRPGSVAETLEVQLVRLQILAVDKRGAPVTDLVPADFEVVDGGEVRAVETVTPSRDVDLQLGLAIDSSGSMVPVWRQVNRLSAAFLDETLSDRDRAFLVDFDSTLRLVQPLTGSKQALFDAFDRLSPDGGTALYDAVLFSLLQYAPTGRKALVVFTDGIDGESRADPRRAVEFGERLGVPVYVIALSSRRGPSTAGRGGGTLALAEASARLELRLITDPTGGRMFQVVSMDQVRAVFAQIESELRQQLVITYTTDRDPLEPLQPRVKVKRKGVKVRSALPIELTDE